MKVDGVYIVRGRDRSVDDRYAIRPREAKAAGPQWRTNTDDMHKTHTPSNNPFSLHCVQ
jgi:hypothetical protein